MKVLLISDHAAPIGGSEISLLVLRDGLVQRGHDVRLFASSAEENGATADDVCLGTTTRWRTLLQSGNPWAAHKLRQILDDFQPDIAHVQLFLTQLSPLILPSLRHIPTLYYAVWYRAICPTGTKMLPSGKPCTYRAGTACHGQGCLPLHDWLPLMGQMALLRRWQNVFDLVLANGSVVQQALLESGISPVSSLIHGVSSWPQTNVKPAPFPLIAFAGRLVPEKGTGNLIAAFARTAAKVPMARLLIAGAGPERDNLEAQIGRLDLEKQVTLLDHISQEEMNERFGPAWVQVVPSVWNEPFGMVAAEAMMRGTPVIASRIGGLSGIVRDGETGLLVSPGNVDELAEAMLLILSDRSLRRGMSRRGQEVAEQQFSQDFFAERMVAVYKNLLAAD